VQRRPSLLVVRRLQLPLHRVPAIMVVRGHETEFVCNNTIPELDNDVATVEIEPLCPRVAVDHFPGFLAPGGAPLRIHHDRVGRVDVVVAVPELNFGHLHHAPARS